MKYRGNKMYGPTTPESLPTPTAYPTPKDL